MSTTYNAGDRVVIVSKRTADMNNLGKMDIYLGRTMTIAKISDNPNYPYEMVEDRGFWSWDDGMIDREATAALRTEAAPTETVIPETANEFSVDYYTDKIYEMFRRLDGSGMLLDNASYYSKDGIRRNVEEWFCKKSKLFDILRKHPNWNEEAKAVIYLNTEHRLPNKDDCKKNFRNMLRTCKCDADIFLTAFDDLSDIEYLQLINDSDIEAYGYINMTSHRGESVLTGLLMGIFSQEPMNVMTDGVCKCINTIFPDIKAKSGQKSSRVANKIFCKFGFDKTPNYNREFAKLADSMNPFDVERITVLSVNIIDFLLMSNGNSWSSCHTIISNSGSNYGGCYMGGTLSYANDGESLIFYTLDSSYHGTDWCFEPKINRQVFFWDYPVLVQERLYPQCNDDTEQGRELVKQYRNVVESIFAAALETPNLWVKENYSRASIDNSADTFMYDDWYHFPNYIVHLKKDIAISESEVEEANDTEIKDSKYVIRSAKHILVGGRSFCINCGEYKDLDGFDDSDNSHNGLLCPHCHPDENERQCYECGCYEDPDTMHYIDGHWYCSDCCFYCEYHDDYEIGESTYVENYGDVCQDALDSHFYYCEDCGRYYEEPTTAVTDRCGYEAEVCSDCLYENYTECEDCGNYIHNHNICEINGCFYCEDCYDSHKEDNCEEVTA